MYPFYFSRLGLCEEAGEAAAPVLGGAVVPPIAEAAAPAESATTGLIARARAIMDGGTKNAERIARLEKYNADLLAKHAAITLQHDQALEQVRMITIERDEAKSQLAEIGKLFATEQAKVKTMEDGVTDALASMGVPMAQLPANAAAPVAEPTLEELQEAGEKESDPVRKGEIAAKIIKLREKLTLKK